MNEQTKEILLSNLRFGWISWILPESGAALERVCYRMGFPSSFFLLLPYFINLIHTKYQIYFSKSQFVKAVLVPTTLEAHQIVDPIPECHEQEANEETGDRFSKCCITGLIKAPVVL